MRKALLSTAVAAAASLAAASAHAQLINGSFETGDLTGWTGNGFTVASDASGYFPTDGSFLASGYAGCDPCTISQTFATTGGTLSGDAAFIAHDYLPYDDFGFVSLFDGTTTINLFSASVATVGDYGSTPWTHFSTTLGAGVYTLTIGVGNGADQIQPSQIVADNFALSGGVPEPATWTMMIAGVFGMGAMLRRVRASALA